MKNILQNIKNSIVFIGNIVNNQPRIVGTGFLISVDNHVHLVTAKHVIEKEFMHLGVFGNTKQLSMMSFKPFNDFYNSNLEWIRHNNNNIDIAVIPFLINQNDKLVFIDHNLLLDNLDDLVELSDVFYGSFQPGINNLEKDGSVNPIYRKGFVSRINNDGTFYIDSAAFPGNSGSPIFNYPNAIEISDQGINIGSVKPVKLLGVMSSYTPYQDIAVSAQTGRTRVIFEENTGISMVFSSQFIKEIIKQENFQSQLNRLKNIENLKENPQEKKYENPDNKN
jgi:hypothetical protein